MPTAQYATAQGGGRADAALLCPLCPGKVKGFADTTSLLQHMKGKHGLDAGSAQTATSTVPAGPAAAPAQFQCNTCRRTFSSKGAMEQHQLDKGCSSGISDANPPLQRGLAAPGPAAEPSQFQCNECSRLFSSKIAMERHQLDKGCSRSFREVNTALQRVVEPLQPEGSEYNRHARHFENMWKASNRKPRIVSIYKIRWSEKLESRFKNYQEQMGPANMGPEAKRRLFHGTTSLCGLLQGLCKDPDRCSACSIASRGFKLSKVRPGVFDGGLHSFGPGIYLTSFSHKANDYSNPPFHTDGHPSGIRTVFIVEAVLGEVYKEKNRRVGMTGPPKGCHTVWGVKGEDLNWDEICCYREDGLKPIAAVTYTVAG